MKHYHIDLTEFRQLWEAGWLAEDLAARYRCTKTYVYWLRNKYGIPDRDMLKSAEPPPPSLEDARISRDSLALSPWVEARVKEMREAKLAELRDEPWTLTKARLWREGVLVED
jgi:hypothetical protein